jgi:hypothetical protein
MPPAGSCDHFARSWTRRRGSLRARSVSKARSALAAAAGWGLVQRAAEEDDVASSLAQAPCKGAADASARAGDDGDSSGQPGHDPSGVSSCRPRLGRSFDPEQDHAAQLREELFAVPRFLRPSRLLAQPPQPKGPNLAQEPHPSPHFCCPGPTGSYNRVTSMIAVPGLFVAFIVLFGGESHVSP